MRVIFLNSFNHFQFLRKKIKGKLKVRGLQGAFMSRD